MKRGSQSVLFPIFSLKKGLIKELEEQTKGRRERFIFKPTEVISCQEFIFHHILTAPSEYSEFPSLESVMTSIYPPPPEAVVSSGRVEKSPHEQEIKFFAKVRGGLRSWRGLGTGWALPTLHSVPFISSPPHPPDPAPFDQPVLHQPLPVFPVHTCQSAGQWWPCLQQGEGNDHQVGCSVTSDPDP